MDPSFPLAVVGIDVSKASLAICYQVDGQIYQLEISNTQVGFAQLIQACGTERLFVMEATGTYYLALAYYLHARGAQVAVLNLSLPQLRSIRESAESLRLRFNVAEVDQVKDLFFAKCLTIRSWPTCFSPSTATLGLLSICRKVLLHNRLRMRP